MDFKVKKYMKHMIHVLYAFYTRGKETRFMNLTLKCFTFRRTGAGHAAKLSCATLPGTSGFTLFAPEPDKTMQRFEHMT